MNSVRAIVVGSILFLFALLTTNPVHTILSEKMAPESKRSFIVQAPSLDQAVEAVNGVRAEITHTLGIINAVGANLTTS